MRFRVENLGPLREAEVDLAKDLIVLTGPNNTGKTYLAWSVYGACWYRSTHRVFDGDEVLEAFVASDQHELDLASSPPNWARIWAKIAEGCQAVLPSVFAASAESFAQTKLSLSAPNDPLAALDSEPAGVVHSVTRDQKLHAVIAVTLPKVLVGLSYKEDWKDFDSMFMGILLRLRQGDTRRDDLFIRVSELPPEQREQALSLRRSALFSTLWLRLRLYRNCVLFPAERIAVNIFAKELALKRTELVDELLEVGPTANPAELLQRRAGRYPWPIRDSLRVANDLANLAKETSPFADLADDLERAVLGGKVSVSDLGELSYAPDHAQDRTLAVHLTASVVKSLASLVFYFRHMARQGDFLIIDEPELNLHPDNQRKIARVLAKAVNRGFKIMISTHSDYVLRELNHLVMLSDPKESVARVIDELGYDRASILAPEKLGVYLFNEHTAKPVPVTVDGFEVETIEREIAALNADAQAIYAARFG